MTDFRVQKTHSNKMELTQREYFRELMGNTPIPGSEILDNLGLFLKRQTLSRIIFMNELYKQIIDVHGVVMEFGVRWGQNLSLFHSFRGMYEPYNYNRKIIGFDTFTGFPEIHMNDGSESNEGDYSVTDNYEQYLDSVLAYHESESPLSHIKKYEIVKGDATETINQYLSAHPETIIAFAYFDFDIYSPTKKCLEAIKERVTKGSIIAFDELNHPGFPGETIALMEVFGLTKYRIRRSPLTPFCSYIVIE
ncbi:TylF/MycF/NovP-related O-methyltransferase [Paenibacillus tarimensis]|uniref:TylF/MycF/NovP-related O-methyltransferase n=1 Tax=Paenibacillus tarimensis TaxID=416012 RepID=UPI001F468169|nr:TylF/MycF/NovP-related O-methyltransferase [Paenibacillus tarimensis]MCF2944116.1 crotonobetainyl-CoA--carnitine CoA-transferase [Paenibacillus tarimensis]